MSEESGDTLRGPRAEETWPELVSEAQRRTLQLSELQGELMFGRGSDLLELFSSQFDDDMVSTALAEDIAEWRRTQELLRNVNNRPRVSEEERLEVEATVHDARELLLDRIVSSALLPLARQYLNRKHRDRNLDGILNRRLPLGSGLLGRETQVLRLETDAVSQVSAIMEQQRSAAIGIAGQRGSGKTTLIEFFTRRQSSTVDNTAGRVRVSAPVQYDARDFFLHVFAELCQSIAGRDTRMRTGFGMRSYTPRPISRLGYHLWVFVLRLIASAAGTVLTYLIYRMAINPEIVKPFADFVGFRVPRTTVPVVVLRQLAFLVAASWVLLNVALAARTIRWRTPAFSALLSRHRRPDLPLFLACGLLVALATTIIVLWNSNRIRLPDESLIFGAGSIALLLICVAFWRMPDWQPGVPVSRSEQRWLLRHFPSSGQGSLTELARSYLDEIRFQQSFTSGWGGKVSLSSPVAGGELNETEGVTLARMSWTLPETVANLRELLAATSERYGNVVLGVDEVDKIEDSASARRFIDDLKAIFQIPGCYFLVSVSDEAVASFDRRGLPFRDSFDSAFDDIISVDVGGLAESENVLSTWVLSMPSSFVGLCHVLSGGLPRDLIRVARELYTLTQPVSLTDAADRLAQSNLLSKLPVVARPVVESNSARAIDLISWAQAVGRCNSGWEDLVARLKELEQLIEKSSLDKLVGDGEEPKLGRIELDCKAILMLAITIMEYCEAIQEETIPQESIENLASLASVKKDLGLHPALAITSLRQFRVDHCLRPLVSEEDDRPGFAN